MGDALRLYGLNALVLNASGGISEAIARTLTKHGATVVAADSVNSGVDRHYAAVNGITGVSTPMTDPDALPALVDEAVQSLGGIDILINDFPLQPDSPIAQVDDALESLLRSRATLTMAMCNAALPQLKKSPQGRIINIGFLRSCFAANGEEASAYAEQDLARMTHKLAVQTGEFAITANYIQPGAVMTPESRNVFQKDKALRDYCIRTSAARRWISGRRAIRSNSAVSIAIGAGCRCTARPAHSRSRRPSDTAPAKRRAALAKLSALCLANADALLEALRFCARNGIGCFRINSQILPVKTHAEQGYDVLDLPDGDEIVRRFRSCGGFARDHQIRTCFHPDQFVVLNSPRPEVVERSIAELEYQAEVAEWVG